MGSPLGVDSLEVVGNHDAADNGERADQGQPGRVRRGLLDGEQEVRFLEEVSVFALLANLVVALDGLLGLVNVDVELLEQFVDECGDLVVIGVFSTPSFTVLAWEADASAAVVPTAGNESLNIPPPNSKRRGVVGLEVGVEDRPAVVVAAVDHSADPALA